MIVMFCSKADLNWRQIVTTLPTKLLRDLKNKELLHSPSEFRRKWKEHSRKSV